MHKEAPDLCAIRGFFVFWRKCLAKTVHVRVSPGEKQYLRQHAEADGIDMTELAKRADAWLRETHGVAVLGRPRPLARSKRR